MSNKISQNEIIITISNIADIKSNTKSGNTQLKYSDSVEAVNSKYIFNYTLSARPTLASLPPTQRVQDLCDSCGLVGVILL